MTDQPRTDHTANQSEVKAQDGQDRMWDAYQNHADFDGHGCPSGGRHEYIAAQIEPDTQVLNIGAGAGRLEKLLDQQGAQVHSVDPSAATVARLRDEQGLGDRARQGHSQSIPFEDNRFDVVIMTEVLEHLTDDVLQVTLPELARVLRAGGRFVGTVPADENLAASRVVCPKCNESFHRWGHEQSFSRERLQQFLGSTFDSVDVQRRVFDEVAALNVKGKILYLLRALQARWDVRASNQNFYFEAICRG